MSKKRIIHFFTSLMLLIVLVFSSTKSLTITALAYEVDYTAEACAKEFLKEIYSAKEISYDSLETLYSLELYDDQDIVIAQVSVFSRDEKTDYAIYNFATSSIDEYGLDCPNALTDFPKDEKLFYGGLMNYFCQKQGTLINTASGENVSKSLAFEKVADFREMIYQKAQRLYDAFGNSKNGSDGIIYWGDIVERIDSSWENTDWGYLEGIGLGSTTDTNGILGDGLNFRSMNYFTNAGRYTEHCGPTALTNIMIYYDWLGYDVLQSTLDKTFARLQVLAKHDNEEGTSMANARTALVTYLSEVHHNATLTNFGNDFQQYKNAINNNQIILTLVNANKDTDDEWGHFVVTLGYEEFRQEYEKQILWWTVTEYNYLRYIRVCDGWNTCNQNRFLDLNNFYDLYLNSAISIEENYN